MLFAQLIKPLLFLFFTEDILYNSNRYLCTVIEITKKENLKYYPVKALIY